jgi:hypothetical protein
MNFFRLPQEYRQLLRRYYRTFYSPLAHGDRMAQSEAQQHFVEVCKGCVPPRTTHEFAYTTFTKYCSLTGISEEEAAAQDFTFPAPRTEPECPAQPLSQPGPEYSGVPCPRCAAKGFGHSWFGAMRATRASQANCLDAAAIRIVSTKRIDGGRPISLKTLRWTGPENDEKIAQRE